MSPSFQKWLTIQQQRIEIVLSELLPQHTISHTLQEVMRYATLGGGKRLRPLLVLAAGELVSAPSDVVEKVAAAIEMVHVYSLIHDDLPAMDDDVLRRGRATCHVQYGEANAILAGDALQACAFEVLSAPTLCSDAVKQLTLIQLLSHAAGARGMCGGQVFDLEAIGKTLSVPELEMMHTMKTGALIRAAVLMGAHCGEKLTDSDFHKLDHFAQCIGLAFQIIDDILDIEGNTNELGKTAGKDIQHNKSTYTSLLGLSEARRKAAMLYEEALSCITHLGQHASRLCELADFIIKRHY